MALRRKFVNGPTVTPESATLLDYIQWVPDSDPHWQAGITYPAVCGDVSSTFDVCVQSPAATGQPNPTKSETAAREWRGATPFTIFAEVECNPVGFWDDSENIVNEAMRRYEHLEVERAFWTGVVHGTANVALPHLAANAVIIDPSDSMITLQTAAVAPTGTYDIVEGLGLLEAELADCYGARGLIYVTLPVFDMLLNQLLVFQRNNLWFTGKGNMVVPGSRFPGTAPDGSTAPTGTSWMYATGALMGYRTAPKIIATRTESFDRAVNTLMVIAERTYVLGWDCCHAAVRVSTGGAVTGTAGSAT